MKGLKRLKFRSTVAGTADALVAATAAPATLVRRRRRPAKDRLLRARLLLLLLLLHLGVLETAANSKLAALRCF